MSSRIVRGLPKEDADFLLRTVGGFGRIEFMNPVRTLEVERRIRLSTGIATFR